ncbi:serine/threonine-protein kinase [Azospirillum sp. Sh1]|uniref:serine/threonine protein kinase n=1 Tax=Azospirillum sp. Sh1 TaxID=2607285 RepID=UPI00165D4AF4|nr:serine/threonine-protein kinase [Azospirillum sp. Sh1]
MQLFPFVEAVGNPFIGGQKIVFPCKIDGIDYVVKVLQSENFPEEEENSFEQDSVDDVFERARREVDILRCSQTRSLPKLGPIDLQRISINNQSLVVFSEEFIDGQELHDLLKTSFNFTNGEIIKAGIGIASAIDDLWKIRCIHRDIKPKNIKRRRSGEYVLLDPGIAFDLEDVSLTATGFVPHTPGYIAPECIIPDSKRDTDCRSDLFLLGIVLYECATKHHPFIQKENMRRGDIISSILRDEPLPITSINPDISGEIENIIMRLLSKRKHSRFKNPDLLMRALAACEKE